MGMNCNGLTFYKKNLKPFFYNVGHARYTFLADGQNVARNAFLKLPKILFLLTLWTVKLWLKSAEQRRFFPIIYAKKIFPCVLNRMLSFWVIIFGWLEQKTTKYNTIRSRNWNHLHVHCTLKIADLIIIILFQLQLFCMITCHTLVLILISILGHTDTCEGSKATLCGDFYYMRLNFGQGKKYEHGDGEWLFESWIPVNRTHSLY